MPRIEIIVAEDLFTLGLYERVLISTWRDVGTLERLTLTRRAFRTMQARWPEGFATATIIETNAVKSTPEEVRVASAAINRDFASVVRGSAFILIGTGFVTASMRMVLAGTTMLSRTRIPSRVFESTVAAGPWIADRVKVADPGELCGAIDECRAFRG